jgi:hypothetical protein
MKGYKGFKKGLVCRGKQYAENTVFEEEKAVICHSGMHFCKNPFDVLEHYNLVNSDGSFNDFAEVEALDEARTDDNKKFCTTKLKVGAKLSFAGFIKACVDFVIEKTTFTKTDCADNDNGKNEAKIGSSGDYAKIDSTGEDSVICCAGHNSIVKAKKGSWITLAEWKHSDEKSRWVPVCVKTEFVDGERIKADTFYKLANGEFTEV